MTDNDVKWKALTAAFPEDEVELLPKPFSKDSPRGECNRPDRNGNSCGGYHGLPAVHLTYVGHAGITMRLNDVVGPEGWAWEPMAFTPTGTPLFSDDGLWIRLTILGQTRIGFGDAQGKRGPNATKEIIGDAIRNAAMRFGVGTYLWSKSDRAKAEAERQGADVDDASPARPATRTTSKTEDEWQTPPPTPDTMAALRAAAEAAGITDKAALTADYGKQFDGRAFSRAGEPELLAYLETLQARAAGVA